MGENELKDSIRRFALRDINASGDEYFHISLKDTIALAGQMRCSSRELEIAALEAEVIPARYQRNIGTIGIAGQLRLLQSRAVVVGAGGLGGLAVDLLARMGVGSLLVVDSDHFTESNLNRQLLATEKEMHGSKVAAAARRAAAVNGAVEVIAHHCRADAVSLPSLLKGCHLALDCLDNLSSRLALEEACRRENIPLVHGAVAGFMGQVAVIRPERPLFSLIYGKAVESGDRGAEQYLGNPAATPAVVAAWQVNEAVKLLAGLEALSGDRLLLIDLLSGEVNSLKIE